MLDKRIIIQVNEEYGIMYYTQTRRDLIIESQIRSYVRQSILLEYRDTQRIRMLNEGIFDFFTNLADGAFGGVKKAVGKAVVKLLEIAPKTPGAEAITKFFEKTGIKDIANIVMGKGGCQETLSKFSKLLIGLVVKDIPKTIGLDKDGDFSLKLQEIFGEPAEEMAVKVAESLCNLSWSEVLSTVPGLNMFVKYLPGGDKEGEDVPENIVDSAEEVES